MRILHIVDKYGFGGVESIVDTLINNFNVPDFEMFYYFLRQPTDKCIFFRENVIVKDYSKFNLYPLINLVNLINRKKIDLIQTHHRKGFYLAVVLSFIFPRVKFVHQEHGDILVKNKIYELVFYFVRNRINGVICVSDYTKKILSQKSKISEKKLFVLNNFSKFFPAKQHEYKKISNKSIYTIGFIGRLSEIKGCEFLIRAMIYLNSNYKLVIAGDGSELIRLKNIVKDLSLDKRVTFLGFVSRVEDLYKNIDILVVPSLNEAYSIALHDSWIFGVPVITSNIDSLRLITRNDENVLQFISKDPLDLAEKVKKLSSDDCLYNKLISEGLKNMKNKTLPDYINSLTKIYGKI